MTSQRHVSGRPGAQAGRSRLGYRRHRPGRGSAGRPGPGLARLPPIRRDPQRDMRDAGSTRTTTPNSPPSTAAYASCQGHEAQRASSKVVGLRREIARLVAAGRGSMADTLPDAGTAVAQLQLRPRKGEAKPGTRHQSKDVTIRYIPGSPTPSHALTVSHRPPPMFARCPPGATALPGALARGCEGVTRPREPVVIAPCRRSGPPGGHPAVSLRSRR